MIVRDDVIARGEVGLRWYAVVVLGVVLCAVVLIKLLRDQAGSIGLFEIAMAALLVFCAINVGWLKLGALEITRNQRRAALIHLGRAQESKGLAPSAEERSTRMGTHPPPRPPRSRTGGYAAPGPDETGTHKEPQRIEAKLRRARGLGRRTVLWVDDHLDNNVNEVLMLRSLGLDIIQATSTEAARQYMSEHEFDLLVTDMNRDEDPRAGLELLRVKPAFLPAIVYTSGRDERTVEAESVTLTRVALTPSSLLDAVLEAKGCR